MIGLQDVRDAAARIRGHVLRTPGIVSDSVSRSAGAEITLKLENLQAVGSFKERGAANRLALLGEDERAHGIVAMSAGNHAQGVARHARLLGIDATIVMPRFTPIAKVSRTEGWGARVVLHGDSLVEAAAHAAHLCESEGRVFIHPFNDDGVMAGQGTMALEMLEDAPELDTLVLPIGGGGFIAGCAVAARALKPGIRIIGVQVANYDSLAAHPGPEAVPLGGPTIAEGIAVMRIGRLPLEVIEQHVERVLVVGEHAIESAIALLAEGAKQVAEGAGAAALAAVLSEPALFAGRRVGLPVCGGNIDSRILANVLLRHLLRDGRLLRLQMDIPDRPGVLADISARIGGQGGNIIEVSHQRLFASPSVQAAQLEVMVEARDPIHAGEIEAALAQTYVVRRA